MYSLFKLLLTHAVSGVSPMDSPTVTGIQNLHVFLVHAVAGTHAVSDVHLLLFVLLLVSMLSLAPKLLQMFRLLMGLLLLASLHHDVAFACYSLAYARKVLRENDNRR
jgi:hypothetical protein